jgi:metallophosphoesterase (TIGR03767 family)
VARGGAGRGRVIAVASLALVFTLLVGGMATAHEAPIPAFPAEPQRQGGLGDRTSVKGDKVSPPQPTRRAHGASETAGHTTLEQTIQGAGGPAFELLELGPGEPYIVREELAEAENGRENRRVSLIYSGQITDFQLSDEESPARVEFFEGVDPSGALSSAHRPQEALVAHATEESIRQLNRFIDASPVPQGDGARAEMANAVMTGDLADNQQLNETEWVKTLLSGGSVTPDSGDESLFASEHCPFPESARTDDGDAYAGVQDYDDYPGAPNTNFWDPDDLRDRFATENWPSYPGLMNRAQDGFEAQGVGVPTYVVFGNHDMLAQGTVAANQGFETVGTGCVKPLAITPSFPDIDPSEVLGLLPSNAMIVPPDPARQYVDKAQFKSVFKDGSQPDAFGFDYVDPAEEAASNGAAGYYAFDAAPGVRFLVLDTPSEGGLLLDFAAGNIDNPQFQWIERELQRAEAEDKLVIAFGHHATDSLNAFAPDEAAPPCLGPEASGDHDVNGIAHDINPGCDRDPRNSSPVRNGNDLTELFNRYPHVISYVAGHSHENRVNPKGSFWEVKSPAVLDWPPQHRLVEVMDNDDCTLSVFGTMVDHGAPVSIPESGTPADELDRADLAAISRTVTYNDPEHRGGDREEAEGVASDRNVELLIDDPRAECTGPPAAESSCDDPAIGTQGHDRFIGTRREDGFRGRGGGDLIRGRGGPDCLWGGRGADQIEGQGGNDRIRGGRGFDDLRGGAGRDDIRGGRGSDTIRGGGGKDKLDGGGGADDIRGGGGDDRLRGGPGRDVIRGGKGDDTINSRDGFRDRVICGAGSDLVRADHKDRVHRSCERVRRR